MKKNVIAVLFIYTVSLLLCTGQDVPAGINYQAVARDNFGKEISNKSIDIKFSVISPNPLGTVMYQEIHSDVVTSKYGVFSLIIGKGTHTGGVYESFSQVQWAEAAHYLKVEVKFDDDFTDMGTMQFLSVPYALYAKKSLEPGPQGPPGEQGPPGDPASDDQMLSFDGSNLAISGGNTVNLSSLNVPHQLSIIGDTLSIYGGNKVGLLNQVQDLELDIDNILSISKSTAPGIDLSRFLADNQELYFDPLNATLSINGGNTVDLAPLKQDLNLDDHILTVTNKQDPAQIDLSVYSQDLVFSPASFILSIEGGNSVDLSLLKADADNDPVNEVQDLSLTGNKLTLSGDPTPVEIDLSYLEDDADADPGNEIQDLSLSENILTITNKTSPAQIDLENYLDNTDNQTLEFDALTNTLEIFGGNSVNLGSRVAFRAKKTIEETGLSTSIDYDFITPVVEYNTGNCFNNTSGIFKANEDGVYCFCVGYSAGNNGDIKTLKIFLNNNLYEVLNSHISTNSSITRTLVMRLNAGDEVKVIINIGLNTNINGSGTGTFSGFRVY